MADGWDAFISYAHAASERSAIALQRGLERFARPWYQRRAIRVFRDNNALSTNPALWPSIEHGLTSARSLIVLLSPGAAASPYVEREVRWWIEHKGQGSILLVLDEGQLSWDAARDGFTADSAVPPALRDAFSEEPRWLDLRWLRDSSAGTADTRFTDALADLSAPIRGSERDELIGEDLAQHRKLRRLTKTAVSLLALLLIASVVASIIAVRQRDDVLRQSVTLRARQLALASSSQLGTDLRMAQLLAVQAYRTEPTETTRQALWQTSFASPSIERFVTFDAPVTALATASDAPLAAAGLADGRVFTFGTGPGVAPVLRATAPAAVTALRLSADGRTVLVQAGDSVLMVDGAGTRPLTLAKPAADDAIALSDSGRRAAVLLNDRRAAITVVDTTSGTALHRWPDPLTPAANEPSVYPQYTLRLAFLGESTLRLAGNDNRWAELNLARGGVRNESWVLWTPTSTLFATGPRLDYLLGAPVFGGSQVTAWPMASSVRGGKAPLAAALQVGDPLGMAVAPDGRFVLINDSAWGLSIATLAPVGENVEDGATPSGVTARVPGLSGIGAMEFVSNERALVAAGSRVAVLQIGGTGRRAPSVPLVPRGIGAVSNYASDARSSNLAVSPDGSRVAVLEKRDAELQVVQVPGHTGGRTVAATPVHPSEDFSAVSGPLWLDDNTVLTLDAGPGGPASGLPAGVQHWHLDLPVRRDTDGEGDREAPLAGVVTGSGVLVATSEGVVQARNRQGALSGSTGTAAPAPSRYELAAFSADATHVALVNLADNADEEAAEIRAGLRVLEVATGQVVHERQWAPTAAAVASVAWAGSTLLVAHVDGTLELLRDAGVGATDTLTVAGIRSSTGSAQVSPIVVGADGLIGVPTRAGLQLVDLATLQPSALLSVPPGFDTEPRAYAFASDGRTLVTGYFGGTQQTAAVSVRDLAAEAVIASVCATAGGVVTALEWRRVVGDTPPDQPGCR